MLYKVTFVQELRKEFTFLYLQISCESPQTWHKVTSLSRPNTHVVCLLCESSSEFSVITSKSVHVPVHLNLLYQTSLNRPNTHLVSLHCESACAVLKFFFCESFFEQSSHSGGLSPVRVSKCCVRSLLCEKSFEQI